MLPRAVATDITTVFGRTLAGLRGAAGLSQTGLGALLSMDRTAIARLEIGRTTLSVPVQTAAEQVLLARQVIRQHGDLALLGGRVAERLLAVGVTVCLDRPPAGAAPAPTRMVLGAVGMVIEAWGAEIEASGLRFGEAVEAPDPHLAVAPRLVLTGPRLHTTRARPVEGAPRQARTPAA